MPTTPFVVKIQLSLRSTDSDHPGARFLIYNEDRSFLQEGEATKEIIKLMGETYKRYFKVEKKKETKDNYELNILHEVEPLNW